MKFLELANKRYSARAYKPDPIEDNKLQQVLEVARLAPTAANRQPFQLIIIHTKGRETELGRIYSRPWFVQAPIVICVCAVPSQGWCRRDGKNYSDVDVAIVVDHMTLAATDLGLGTCWVAGFDPTAAREVLNLPEDIEPIAFITLAYPTDQPKPKSRKSINDLVRYENW